MDNYTIEKTDEGILLDRKNCENLQLTSAEGLCRADLHNSKAPRNIKSYTERVLNPGLNNGKIGDGKRTRFDDRKIRYSGSSIGNGLLELRFGFTYYGEFL